MICMLVTCFSGCFDRKQAWFATVDLQVVGLVSTVDCLLTARQEQGLGAGGSGLRCRDWTG